jgi:hypothetical protein
MRERCRVSRVSRGKHERALDVALNPSADVLVTFGIDAVKLSTAAMPNTVARTTKTITRITIACVPLSPRPRSSLRTHHQQRPRWPALRSFNTAP